MLVKYLQEHLGDDRVHFHTGVQYRHLLVIKGGDKRIDCTPPDIPLRPFRPLMVKPMEGTENISLPEGGAELTPKQTADLINDLILRSQVLLENHPVNMKRKAEVRTLPIASGRGVPVIVRRWSAFQTSSRR